LRYALITGLLISAIWLFVSCNRPPTQTPATTTTPVPVTSQREAKEGWEVRWQTVLAQARKEGKIVLYGPPIPQTRQGFIETFQRAYPGIALEYTAIPGALGLPKVLSERKAGIELVDLYIGGTITILGFREYVQPIKPFLILPEVLDTTKWWDKRLDFSDDAEKLNLVFTLNVSSRVIYNSEHVNPADISSFLNLTEPKWKDKIIMWDPRVVGSGNATATFWYLHPKLGLDYMKAFAKVNPVFTRDVRFLVETVARGKYGIGISPDNAAVNDFQKAGTPVKWAPFMKEGTYSSAAFGSVGVMDKPPHPAAATIFLNWLLGKEGQTVWTTTSGYASRRIDAPVDHLAEAEKPVLGTSYMPGYKEEYILKKDEVMNILNDVFAGF